MLERSRPSCRRSAPVRYQSRLAWSPRAERRPGRSAGLELLKWNMLHRAWRTFGEPHFKEPLRVAAERAADLAQTTGYPMLVFPELFEEIAIAAMLRSEYQLRGRL
jgi:hypothetical protein